MSYKILVIGDSCIDIFQYGTVKKICAEAPCVVFEPTYQTKNDGMAGNVFANLKALDNSLEIDFITNERKPTKIRYVDEKSNQMIMRQDIDDVINDKPQNLNIDRNYSAIVISDYNKGFLTEAALERISNSHPLTFLDTKKKLGRWSDKFTFIKINAQEYEATRDTCIEDNLIVTLGEKGAIHKGTHYYVKNPVIGGDISGCGDTFLAGLGYKYLLTSDIGVSIEFANECAGKVIGKKGVSTI